MDNVLLVVDDLEAAKAFFAELGLELEGETVVEGESVDRLIGLDGVRATIASMRTPDGHGRIELDKFHTPAAVRRRARRRAGEHAGHAPHHVRGRRHRRASSAACAATAPSSLARWWQYEDTYRLCYVRGPEGIVIGLAEQLS